MELNVKVCNVSHDNIHVVDIISNANMYAPTFLSSFSKVSLSVNEFAKIVIKNKVDNLNIGVKHDDLHKINKLNSLLQESETDVVSHLPSVNEVLLAKKNNIWCRCSVLSNIDNTYKVYFVDSGDTVDVQKYDMRNLPDTCKSYPIFALKISTESDQPIIFDKCYNIYVLDILNDIYNAKLFHQHFVSSIHRNELIPNEESSVIFCHKEREKIFLQRIEDGECLSEVLKLLGNLSPNPELLYKPDVGEIICAMSQLDGSWYRGCIEEVLSCDEYKVLFIDYGNCENVQRKHLQPIPLALTKFPSLCIPVKFVNNEVMETVKLEKLYKVVAESQASNGVQVIKLAENNEVATCTNLQSCSENEKKSDTVKRFLYSSCKCVPFNSGEQDIVIYSVDDGGFVCCAPYDTENIQANLGFSELITEHINNNGIPFDDYQPETGELVLALYPVDNSWYRALIINNKHPVYDVCFVDYGNNDALNITSLRKMDEKFMKFLIQAHMCSLSGFTYPVENLSKVCNELKKFTLFSYQEPIKANVTVADDDIILNVPVITSHLLQQNLATAVSEK